MSFWRRCLFQRMHRNGVIFDGLGCGSGGDEFNRLRIEPMPAVESIGVGHWFIDWRAARVGRGTAGCLVYGGRWLLRPWTDQVASVEDW